ncbi:MAG: endopeptidase La, partial [Lentisphaeria bacterium]|nr:endopeptidase La [Lentisphaeria bacterium]
MNEDINISLKSPDKAPPASAPMIILHKQAAMPYCLASIVVDGRNETGCAKAFNHGRLIAAFPEMPDKEDFKDNNEIKGTFGQFKFQNRMISRTGTLCRIIKQVNFPDGMVRVLVRGISRITMLRVDVNEDYDEVAYEKIEDTVENKEELGGMVKSVASMFADSTLSGALQEEFKIAVTNVNKPGRMADLMTDSLPLSFIEKFYLLAELAIDKRLHFLIVLMNRTIEISRISAKIQAEVHEAVGKTQRDFFLREQLSIIKKELGEDNRNPDIIEIEQRLASTELPEHAENVVRKELSRLEVIPQMSPEYHVAYNYVDTILSVPWSKCSEDRLDVAEAAQILDEDHYGLKDVKERILEFLSVLKLKKDGKSPIICLVGPPGVGKTSLGKSIARALNREFIRIALGGVRDEAEIRGHRRTYIGAMPGRIIQNLKKAGVCNPLIMLDEIDKLSKDTHGDPASALLEVLDSAQNSTFSDHYLELEYDLSKVFFIATANTVDSIPEPLLDRMELIRLPGYTAFEKKEIARQYLVPRELDANGLNGMVKFNVSAVNELIDYYTREAGVRQLDRVISQCCRKAARKIVDGEYGENPKISLKKDDIATLLGCRKFTIAEAERKTAVGSATGMAWTSVGGVILMVEVLKVPGKGSLKLTGSLGKVMQESAEAAFTYIKSRA